MPHISYSELKIWAECPFKHKLKYIDRVTKFVGNEFTAFGKALHSLCEHSVVGNLNEEDYEDYFEMEFLKELQVLKGKVEFRPELVGQMRDQAKKISPLILPEVAKYLIGKLALGDGKPRKEPISLSHISLLFIKSSFVKSTTLTLSWLRHTLLCSREQQRKIMWKFSE